MNQILKVSILVSALPPLFSFSPFFLPLPASLHEHPCCNSSTLVCFSSDLLERRTEVVDKLHDFEEAMDPILAMLGDPEVSQLIESGK